MFFARNIFLTISIKATSEKSQSSWKFPYFRRFPDFRRFNVCKVEIEKIEMLQVKDIILLHLAKNCFVLSQKISPLSQSS